MKIRNIEFWCDTILDWICFGDITTKVVDSIDFVPCEVEYRGRNNKVVGYWAYGYFDTNYPFPRWNKKPSKVDNHKVCKKCKSFELYHDCDDPDVLPNYRLKKFPENCTQHLISNCKKI